MVGIRQQRQQRTREALLDAAASVFASHGYAGASVPQIAHEAGVSTGAIYANFTGKQELFLAMMRRVVEAGAAARQRSAAETTDRDELLNRMVTTWTATVDTAPDIVLLMAEFWLYALRNPPHNELVAELLADVRANLAASIVGAGVVPDADRAGRIAVAVQAVAYGYAMQRLVDEDAVSPTQLVETVDWILRGAVPAR
ncbi:MAG: TetR/AcrR family transcriptional regulator [Nocardiopsaceae bacterium]|nr:TetR/AcrR family transcriptional regulator [Nocardiopsaceae bacterium]